MPKIIHFEISADDPTRASAFYERVFGWRINKWGGPLTTGLSAPMIATRPALTER
jgi:predicted enzyme related to lactoylglutathione lyase